MSPGFLNSQLSSDSLRTGKGTVALIASVRSPTPAAGRVECRHTGRQPARRCHRVTNQSTGLVVLLPPSSVITWFSQASRPGLVLPLCRPTLFPTSAERILYVCFRLLVDIFLFPFKTLVKNKNKKKLEGPQECLSGHRYALSWSRRIGEGRWIPELRVLWWITGALGPT